MNKLGNSLPAVTFLGTCLALAQAQAQEPLSLSEVLEISQQRTVSDPEAHERMLEEFESSSGAEQQQLLEAAQAELAAAEALSTELENAFDENQLQTENVRDDLDAALGDLNELFGVLAQVAAEARNEFEASLTNIEFPERTAFLNDFAQKLQETGRLPDIAEIERLWFELLREATELGKIKRLTDQRYVTADGQEVSGDVVRVGAFNVVTEDAYLRYSAEANSLAERQRQPGALLDEVAALVNAQPGDGIVRFGVDVTGGDLLDNLLDTPTLRERIDEGGVPGYVIIVLGVIGILLSIERLVTLGIAGRKVHAQLKTDTPNDNNALGRVMRVAEQNRNVDVETLELKLSEAILKETPPLQRGILFIKVISVVAPLLGLLGTVVGMINTFQDITLFGTGDPTVMASGISQALITTALGLTVAIPTVLLHTIVNGRSRAIIGILRERSAGIVAAHAEKTRA